MPDYSLGFADGWQKCFEKLDKGMRLRVWKKIQQLHHPIPARHLKEGLPYFVSEIGQYRLCYSTDEKQKVKTIWFVGDHKQYEKWLGL